MIAFLYGPDSYRRTGKLKSLLASYAQKYPSAPVRHFDLSLLSADELLEFARGSSLFTVKKIAVVKNWEELESAGRKSLKKTLAACLEDGNFLIIIVSEKRGTGQYSFLMRPPVVGYPFPTPSGGQIAEYIQEEAKNCGITLMPDAISLLVKHFGGDTWSIVTEIQKAREFALHKRGNQIEARDLLEMGEHKAVHEAYLFIKSALLERTPRKTLPALERVLMSGEDPNKIFNFLSAMKNISPNLLSQLADYDAMVKSGKIDYPATLLSIALL